MIELFKSKMDESGFSADDAEGFGFKMQSAVQVSKLAPNFDERCGIAIPYHEPSGKRISGFLRVRYLEEPKGFSTSNAKYVQPSDTEPRAYFPLGVPWGDLFESGAPLFITEGEFKAACMCKTGHPTIGLGGVYNWMSKKYGHELIPDLEAIDWEGRTVILVFDSDVRTNRNVRAAQSRLAETLLARGAAVQTLSLPQTRTGKTGADDYIVEHGVPAFVELVKKAADYGLSAALWDFDGEFHWLREEQAIVDVEEARLYSPHRAINGYFANRVYKEELVDEEGNPTGGTKDRNACREWLKWPYRTELEAITFKPGEPRITSGNEYNLWDGWGVQPKRGNTRPWRDLLDHVFDGDHEKIQWFERWCAYQIQHPGEKLYTAVYVWGAEQGNGKSFIGYLLGQIFGRHFQEVGTDRLLSKYNEWAARTQFVMCEEIGVFESPFSDRRVAGGHMKGLITRKTISVNKKYQPEYEVPDCIAYFLTANHIDAFYIEKNDRRFFVHEATRAKREPGFYKVIDDWQKNGGIEYLMYRLLHLDLGDFDPKAAALYTKDKDEMIELGASDLDGWLLKLKREPDEMLGEMRTSDVYTAEQLLLAYDPTTSTRVRVNGMSRALKSAGFMCHPQVYTNTGRKRLWIVRNCEKWAAASSKAVKEHYEGSVLETSANTPYA